MDIGLIGAGRMGQGLWQRWQTAGHTVHVFDPNPAVRQLLVAATTPLCRSREELVGRLTAPRVVWLMIPAGDPVHATIAQLKQLLKAGDTIIDGGNSRWQDSRAHADELAKRGINFLDVGVSGGIAGATHGYALMIGGGDKPVAAMQEIFAALAAPQASAHVGPAGAGHFVKMVHNAIEYGMMQSIGEGFDLLKGGPYGGLPLADIAELWNHGTIIRSFLMELTSAALQRDATLTDTAAYVDDSGEGRWSVETAVAHAVPFWVNTAALYARFDSRQPDSFAAKLIAALRHEFGGHALRRRQ